MTCLKPFFCFLFVFFTQIKLVSQETLPIYQDYLSDNVFLVHPAAAGIGDVGKIRFSIRMEGLGVANSPQIQTANIHGTFSEDSKAAFGITLLNNATNTIFNQKAARLTYAYHLPLDESKRFEQLSFGLSLTGVQNLIGQSNFSNATVNVITTSQPLFYLNADVGASYHLKGLSTYFTVKNIYLSGQNEFLFIDNVFNPINFVFGGAYFFGKINKLQFEPSFLLQYKRDIGERVVDVNFKVYKLMTNGQVWAAISYRKSFFENANGINPSSFISPLIGFNFRKMMFSYTYSSQRNEVLPTVGAFHQLSLGFDILIREPKAYANPNINGILF